jgi:hypothetical protein
LSHAAAYGNRSANKKMPLAELFESQAAPFDHIYCIPVRAAKADGQATDASETLTNYLALDQFSDARAALRSCRSAPTAREQSPSQTLRLRKLGYASLGDQTRSFIHELAGELAEAVKRHWIGADESADWEALVRAAHQQRHQQAVGELQMASANAEAPITIPAVAPAVDTSPIALRGRFEAYKSLAFASEIIRQIQSLPETRDHRGRPRFLPRDIIAIVDAARAFIGTFVRNHKEPASANDRFAHSPLLCSLVTTASQRVLGREIQGFDPEHPERCFGLSGIDERMRAECLSLLQQGLADPEISTSIASLMDAHLATKATLNSTISNLLGCGCDRRALIFIPRGEKRSAAAEELRTHRPLASIVPADVDDVIVVSEESAISPRSVGQGLERMYPGIADAAHRLHTRTDIPWEKLV